MARIIISICGEGRGHASRAISLIELLHPRHQLVIASFGSGFLHIKEYLDQRGINARLVEIRGIEYKYKNQSLAPVRTYLGWAYFMLVGIRRELNRCKAIVDEFDPDLAITDFEPCMPRLANKKKIPCISIDHQHFLRFYDISRLPFRLKIRCAIGALVCRCYVPKASIYIVTAFFKDKARYKSRRDVIKVGSIIKRSVRDADVSDFGFILSYVRKELTKSLKDAFFGCGRTVVVYGLGYREPMKNIIFKAFSQEEFVEDLASSSAVIGAAGNQLIGEALHLGKPYLAIPEKDHHEQMANAYNLKWMGRGTFVELEKLGAGTVKEFLDDYYSTWCSKRKERGGVSAIEIVIDIIESTLSQSGMNSIGLLEDGQHTK